MNEKKEPNILFIQERQIPHSSIIDYLKIPEKEYEVFSITKNKKILTQVEEDMIFRLIHNMKPKLIISIGAKIFKLFYPELKLTKNAGKLFEMIREENRFVYCPLFNPERYQHVKFTNEYKQLDKLKKYLMRNYNYGLITKN